jgi:tRNA (mo5U34)-methyltransferase
MTNETDKTSPDTQLAEKVSAFPFWYHKIELPGGITTPGHIPPYPDIYKVPKSLEGMRVLDVGAWDGYWSFEALKRGAKEVVAIDDFSDNIGSLKEEDRKAWQTFDLCREALGYSEQQCQRVELSIYEVTPSRFGHFDVVFFFGTLYHLRYPLLALDLLSAVCKQQIFIESAILDDFSPYRGGLGNGYTNGQMVAEFYPGKEYGNNFTNWWVPTLLCLAHMVKASGFNHVEMWKLTDAPSHVSLCRGFVQGLKSKS